MHFAKCSCNLLTLTVGRGLASDSLLTKGADGGFLRASFYNHKNPHYQTSGRSNGVLGTCVTLSVQFFFTFMQFSAKKMAKVIDWCPSSLEFAPRLGNPGSATGHCQMIKVTRMHSSRMRTTHLLPISPSMHCSQGVYLVWGDLVLGGCSWSAGDLVQGGVPGPRGVPGPGWCSWSHWGTCPGTPPVNRILDTRFWKYYLAPNFVCGW